MIDSIPLCSIMSRHKFLRLLRMQSNGKSRVPKSASQPQETN